MSKKDYGSPMTGQKPLQWTGYGTFAGTGDGDIQAIFEEVKYGGYNYIIGKPEDQIIQISPYTQGTGTAKFIQEYPDFWKKVEGLGSLRVIDPETAPEPEPPQGKTLDELFAEDGDE